MMLTPATIATCRIQSPVQPLKPSGHAKSTALFSRQFHGFALKKNTPGRFAPRHRATLVRNAAVIQKNTLPELKINAQNKRAFEIHDYGDQKDTYGKTLAENKAMLMGLLDDIFRELKQEPNSEESAGRKALILAMAMQETELLDLDKRDKSKDQSDSANATFLNMNYGMLKDKDGAGYSGTREQFLKDFNNGKAGLKEALKLLLKCFDKFGIERTLNYQRGGYTGFQDGVSYDCQGYRDSMATMYQQINEDPDLLKNSKRVAINLGWQGDSSKTI